MDSYSEHLQNEGPTAEKMEALLAEKAHELFTLCDREEKGFINKRDMQRLQAELNLTAEQLETVFDSLDDDGNGFLTLEEFTGGFGNFLGLTAPEHNEVVSENIYELNEENDERNFEEMLESVGGQNLFILDDRTKIKRLWQKMCKDAPELTDCFEEFLMKITGDLNKTQEVVSSLETALHSKTSAHDDEVKKLYEEMEYQIRREKEKMAAEEKAKERQIKEALEIELNEKDQQLQELLQKHKKMEERLADLNTIEVETKQENDRLMKDKDSLEEMLLRSQENLEESQSYINQLCQQRRDEKRERATAALKISEGIAMERESLVKQLDSLRQMNQKLRDDRDEAMALEARRRVAESQSEEGSAGRKKLCKQGSILGKYFPGPQPQGHIPDLADILDGEPEDDGIDSDVQYLNYMTPNNDDNNNEQISNHSDNNVINGGVGSHNYNNSNSLDSALNSHEDKSEERKQNDSTFQYRNSNTSLDQLSDPEDQLYLHSKDNSARSNGDLELHDFQRTENKKYAGSKNIDKTPVQTKGHLSSSRQQHVGANGVNGSENFQNMFSQPERVFKIVFVGDSGVGKSCFIQRFCSDQFKSAFQATIGIDFQVKTMKMDGQEIVLQMWDTAGQERFRSITKQYFRKADGVIVMYDVSSETTFKSVRNWMSSVQDGTGEGVILALVGNKTDLANSDDARAVKYKDGVRLSEEYGAIFYETSAKTGQHVAECVRAMASLLKEKEDREIEKSLILEEMTEKKKCCS